MSYRVDIPTLSANEVYTLTFEYEGTETIQLVVGDLTLETTDRRVVFTTTSPVNYIESNMNLTNLNVYEGYYESDDFGGEYTQESYIEGKSLINLMPASSPKTLSQGWSLDFDETTGVATIVFDNNTNGFSCSMRSFGMMGKLKPATYYTYFVEILENSLVDGSGNKPNIVFYGASSYLYPSTQCPYNVDTIKGDCASKSSTERWTIKNEASPGKYVWAIKTVDTFVDTMVDADKIFQTAALNGTIKVRMMIVEGDYVDNPIETNWFPQGIGCVKSPTIKSLSPENLYVSPLKYREPLRGYEYYHNDGTVEIYPNGGGAYSTIDLYTGEDVGFSYNGSQKTWYVNNGIKLGLGAGTYYFCCEIELVANKQITDFTNKPQIDVIYDNAQYFVVSGNFTETYDGEKYYYKGIFGAANRTVTDDIRGIYVGIWSYGIGGVEKYTIRNITLTKEASLRDICAISKSSIITTPDDLELYCNHYYDRNTKTSSPCYQDILDLTTGTVTRKNIKVRLNDYLLGNLLSGQSIRIRNHENLINSIQILFDHYHKNHNLFPSTPVSEAIFTSATGLMSTASQGSYEGWWLPVDGLTQAFCNDVYIVLQVPKTLLDGVDTSSVSALKEWLVQQDFTLIMRCQPYTEQLSLNPLKSYRNGSITTSSQQLTPTLKTTLPVSNKFTTTNLTSGQTYNIYFDGTATKLDAGGTIITNPVSPCEVECGGTTLTIEGADIQNVRVLETSVKNEVGNNGTSDVELSRIKTANSPSDSLISTKIEYWEQTSEYGNALRYVLPIQVQPNTKYILNTTNIQRLFAIWDVNGNQLVLQNIYANSPYIWTTPADCPSEVYLYLVYQTDVNRAHLDELRMFEGEIDFGYQGQQEPLISQTISTLEQPIKLRSLGTTYDSYNPITGELIKRIGVSETDGSYSVLSSPIVSKFEKSCSFMGNLATSDQLLVYNGATKNGDVITLNKANKWSLVQLAGSCTRMEKGKQYMCILHDIVGDMTGVVFVRQQDTATEILPMENNRVIFTAMSNASNRWCYIQQNEGMAGGGTVSFKVSIIEYFEGAERLDIPYFNTYEQRDLILQSLFPTIPHLYTNGQVKVYSDSEVYPTTILNGQSTNNYEVNELNKSNNYTIRYDGECESINLNGKSNEQGTNRIVKTSTNGSGNLTFVNDNGDIDNVLLVQNDVREQEIKHFNGLQTVEVSKLFVSNKQNLFEAYMKNDFEFLNNAQWGAQAYGSLHNGVFKCGNLSAGENLQWAWNLIKPHVDNVYSSKLKEDNPIVLANKVYNISFNISIVDHHAVDGGHSYNIRAYDFDGNEVSVQKATGGTAWLGIGSNGVTNPTPKGHINQNVIFSKDVYCFALHADYGGAWKFDCTITDFTICEPENAKPNVPLVYEYIDLPRPVQLNGLPDGTCDTYNPITGEYVQNVGYAVYDDTTTWNSYAEDFYYTPCPSDFDSFSVFIPYHEKLESTVASELWAGNSGYAISSSVMIRVVGLQNKDEFLEYMKQYPLQMTYRRKEPITTQLTPITIPTFESGTLQLITTDGKVFPMIEYSMPTNNRYDTSSWEAGKVYTQRNMTEVYFNESTTPMTPTETMTLTTDHISSGSIILNDNGNGLIVLKGNYTGRDIPYFTGMRSVEAIEVETTPSPDQPLLGKGGRR